MNLELKEEKKNGAVIKIIGVGGAGGNALDNMVEKGMKGVEFIAANTDYQDLSKSKASIKLQLGLKLTAGRGSGGDPKIGAKAALEDKDKIEEILAGSDLVFITAGMGGGTGTGAAPVIARIAKEKGILVVSVVTKPFMFEGKPRRLKAEEGMARLKEVSDAIIVISNDKLFTMLGKKLTLVESFKEADNVLYLAVSGILDIVDEDGYINVDFNDVKSVLTDAGEVIMGTGTASGEQRLLKATDMAVNNPLVDRKKVDKVKKVLVQLNLPVDTPLDEFYDATEYFKEFFGDDTDVSVGVNVSSDLESDQVRVTIIMAASKRETGEDDTTEDTRARIYVDIDDRQPRAGGTNIRFQDEMSSTGSSVSNEYGYRTEPKNIDDYESPAYYRKYRDEFKK